MKKRLHNPSSLGLSIVGVILLLTIIGSVFVFEASVAESLTTFGDRYYLFKQHLIGLVIGWIAFFVGLLLPSKLWIKLSPLLMIGALVLMVMVFIPGIGLNLNGASRWLSIGGFTLQPVEVLKFGMIVYLAAWLPKQKDIIPFLIVIGLPAILLILQPDLGSLLVVFSVAVSMYFIAGGNMKQLGILAGVSLPMLILAIVLSPYRMRRLTTFFNPESDPLGASFHIRQIILALGRGGWFGQGIGNSTQRFSYIPEASTDSIFAIVAEELGFIGSLFIILLFGILLLLSFHLVKQIDSEPEIKLLGTGILIWITVQTILNLSAVVALVPLTGIPLPFFSYGRSALIMLLFASGVLLKTGKRT